MVFVYQFAFKLLAKAGAGIWYKLGRVVNTVQVSHVGCRNPVN